MDSGRLRILVVEHDAAFARAVIGMLETAPDTIGGVALASSLDEALARLAETEFEIILLEFFLPDGAGLGNIPVLRERAPLVPVIVLGAAADEAFALEAMHEGAQDYLLKTEMNARWLLRSIRYTRERHAAERALLAAEEKYHSIFNH